MKNTLLALITISSFFSFALQASALDVKSITAKPTADNPQYDNRTVWPMLVGDEYFLKQKWSKARLLIWSPPGSEDGKKKSSREQNIPANWIDAATGKPAVTAPDMKTDVIFPDSEKKYSVRGKGFVCRHLTLGRNIDFQPGGGHNLAVFGNLWIRPGAKMYVYRALCFVGNSDTFFRQDWPKDGKLKKLHDEGTTFPYDPKQTRGKRPWWAGNVCRYFRHDKPGKTTEVIGFAKTGDEVRIQAGTFIIGRDSRFLCGGASTAAIGKAAIIALMDGAMHGHASNQSRFDCTVAEGGAITAGTPDRPIKRDARIGVGYRNWMNMEFPDQKVVARGGTTRYGLFGGSFSGKLIGYPAPNSDAKLVVGWQGISYGGFGRGTNMTANFKEAFTKLPPKITIWLGKNAEVENVRFEDLHRGGIVLPDRSIVKQWKNVTFGKSCLSKDPKELIREYKGKVLRGQPSEPLKPEKKYTSM
ncbi:MAG: hypothetical protein HN350_19215 [Phycisphaerales bacterium]|nr:hypothetical protein [Phycisphaerales bacterium]